MTSRDDADELDPDALDRLRRIGGQGFLVEMIDLFLENGPARLGAARTALEAGDATTLRRAVHSLKSTAATLGVWRLQREALVAEGLAARGELEGLGEQLAELERLFESARGALEMERHRSGE